MGNEKPTPKDEAWVGGDTVDESNPLEGVDLENMTEKKEEPENDRVPSVNSGSSPDAVGKNRLKDLINKIEGL